MNLIVTCARHYEEETSQELERILKEFGDTDLKVTITTMSGILTAQTTLDPILVVEKIREMVLDEPWSIRYCLRIIPIQKICETKITEIKENAIQLARLISEKETYRILVEKRDFDISSQEIIKSIAEKIKNKVSLEFPDKIVLIEILNEKTGISVLRKQDILSIHKTKRSISE